MNNSRTVQLRARLIVAFVATVVAFLIAGATMLASSAQAYAADQTQHGSEGVVVYEHDGLPDTEKRVSYGDAGTGYTPAPDIYDGGYQVVYCINPTRSATSAERWNAHFRWRWNLTANQWLLDNNKRNLTNPDSAPGSAGYNDLIKVLYVGFGVNGTNKNFSYSDTQDAVYHIVTGTGSPNAVNEEAATVDLATFSATAYMYLPDSDAKQTIQNTVGLKVWSSTPPEPPAPAGPTATVGFEGTKALNGIEFSTDSTAEQFAFRLYWGNGKDDGMYHTRIIPKDSASDNPGQIFFGEMRFVETGADPSKGIFGLGETTFHLRELQPSEGVITEIEGVTYDETEYTVVLDAKKEGDAINVYYKGENVAGKNIGLDEFTWTNTKEDKPTVVPTVATSAEGASGKTIKAAASQTITDTVTLTDLVEGVEYTLTGKLMNKDTEKEIEATCTPLTFTATAAEASAESVTKSMTFSLDASKLALGTDLVVFETLSWTGDAHGDTTSVSHADLTDAAQTVTVGEAVKISKQDMGGEEIEGAKLVVKDSKGNEVDSWTSTTSPHEIKVTAGDYVLTETAAPSGYQTVTTEIEFSVDADGKVTLKTTTVEPDGAVEIADDGTLVLRDALEPTDAAGIGTTVSVNGVTADSDTVLNLENSEVASALPVVDTVEYEGLTAGASYTLTGELMKVVGKKATPADVDPVTITVKASDEGKGTWEMDFGSVQLEEDTYYVVFETLEGTDIPGGSIEHKDITDKAQAINVGTGWENTEIYEEQPPFTPVFAPEPILATTVTAGTASGTSTRAATLTYNQAANVNKVTDTVAYSDFTPGETIKLTGTLYSSKDGKDFTVVSGKTVTEQVTVSDSGTGTWTMDFSNVKLEAGTTYVVTESAERSDGSKVEHADFTDKAQTIIVGARPNLPAASSAARGTTAKTADASGPAVIALGVIALVAVGAAYGARRRTNK